MNEGALESRTQEIGREIFHRLGKKQISAIHPKWWDDRLMGFTMRDEAVKVQLFRLVDALPAPRTHRAVARHLREYLQTVDSRLPPVLRRAVGWIPNDGFVGGFWRGTIQCHAPRKAIYCRDDG